MGLALAGVFVFSAAVFGQQERPPQGPPPENQRLGDPRPDMPARPNLFRELGLSPEQMQALRKINQGRMPMEESARKRFNDANRALNLAIYSDQVDEAGFTTSLAEYKAAQAELAQIKFSNELAVRRILTPAQLTKFRELRRRFAEARENPGDGPMRQGPPPGDQIRRRQPPPGN